MDLINADQYIHERVDDQLTWLGRASQRNKSHYMNGRILEILLGTFITISAPLLGTVDYGPQIIAIAGGGVAITGAISALTKNQENWLRYRSLAENIKREKFLFITGTPPYDGMDSYPQLVQTVENLMLDERSTWSKQMTSQPKSSSQETHAPPDVTDISRPY